MSQYFLSKCKTQAKQTTSLLLLNNFCPVYTDEFEKKKKPTNVLWHGSVTRYGPRNQLPARKGLKGSMFNLAEFSLRACKRYYRDVRLFSFCVRTRACHYHFHTNFRGNFSRERREKGGRKNLFSRVSNFAWDRSVGKNFNLSDVVCIFGSFISKINSTIKPLTQKSR